MDTRLITFILVLCAVGLTAGCIPIPLLPGSDVHETENKLDELLDNKASRRDVIKSLGYPRRQYESVISYKACRRTAGVGFFMCLPYQCAFADARGLGCFELILEFDDHYRLTGYKKLPFEGEYKTPVGSIWETTYPEILRKMANNGDVESQFNLYLIEKDNPENIKRLCNLAGTGHTKAQMEVAHLYWRRDDIDDNRSKSYMWYMLAATTDYSNGLYTDEPTQKSAMVEAEYKRQKVLTPDQLRIATQLQSQWKQPEHCERDIAILIPEGSAWIRHKEELYNEIDTYCPYADLGYEGAQKRIGDLYYLGLFGLEKDFTRAYVWYSLADRGGDGSAAYYLDCIVKEMSPQQLQEAQNRLSKWKSGHCKREVFDATYGKNK